MGRFKQAKALAPGDRIRVSVAVEPRNDAEAKSEHVSYQWQIATIFNVGETTDERGKPVKAQHMDTGNVAKGVFLIFEDGGEALLHPEERIEVLA